MKFIYDNHQWMFFLVFLFVSIGLSQVLGNSIKAQKVQSETVVTETVQVQEWI